MKLICEGDKRNWLEFTHNITQRQRREYAAAIIADNVKQAQDDDAKQTARDANEETLERILKEVVTDGVLIVGEKEVRGIEKILMADPDDFSIIVASFFGNVFFEAVGALRRLGKPIESV